MPITRQGASGKAGDPKIRWCVWKGDEPASLAERSPTYRLGSSHEHGSRFEKPVWLWEKPRWGTPAPTERWTQVVACAHQQWVLARPLLEGISRPWENRRWIPTLTQVWRAMPTLVRPLGTPARPPHPRGKAPGRAKGFHPKPRTRHPVIRNTEQKKKTSKTAPSA